MNESRTPFDAEQFARAANYSIDFTDWAVASLEDRVSAIEETIAARWPRSWLLRRRLARRLRDSVRPFAGVAPDFRRRRSEAVSEQLIWRTRQ